VLLVIHEFFGLNEGIAAKAQLLADELGCLCVAPDTFRGVSTSFIPQAIWLALTTPQERVNADLEDVVKWASSQPGVDGRKVGVMGFCYGGGKAIRYTTEVRPTAATAIYYGSPVLDVTQLKKLRAPVCAVYGTKDVQFPQSTIDGFKGALEEAGVEHEVVSYYGVGHAFWSSVEQVRDEEMPQIAAYRLTTSCLRNFFEGQESFARKRAFLEFMLAEQEQAAADPDGDQDAQADMGDLGGDD
jgi:carboxymethylenebutenolidase